MEQYYHVTLFTMKSVDSLCWVNVLNLVCDIFVCCAA